MDQKKTEQAYIYDKAFNGMTVRIPADKYEQWKQRQEEYRTGKRQPKADPEMVGKLRKLFLGE